MKFSSRYYWLAVAVLLLTTFLRIYHLNLQGLWGDEGWSVQFTEPRTPVTIAKNLIDDLHPPLYFVVLGGWRELAGSSEPAMRLIAVYSALITVALVYRIGKKLFNPNTGVTAALILALADKHTVLAQEVRHYPSAFMWMALSSLIFLYWVEKPTRRNVLGYALVVILMVYTHYYTTLILPVQLLYAMIVLRPWKRVGQWLLMTGLASLAFLPWLPIAIYQLQIRPEGILHSSPRSWETLRIFTIDYVGRPVPLALGLMLIGIIAAWRVSSHQHYGEEIRGRSMDKRFWYPVLWFAFPLGLTIAIYDYVTLLTDRNMALLLLPIALLVGRGITAFKPSSQVVLCTILIANGLTSLDSYSDHEPWRELAVYVAANHPTGEPILLDVGLGDKAMRYHLTRELSDSKTPIYSLNQWRLDNYKIEFWSRVENFLVENNGFWVVYWGDQPYEMDEFYQKYGYVRTASHTEYHRGYPIDWYHYDLLPPLEESLGTYDSKVRLHQVKVPTAGRRGGTLDVSLWWSTGESLGISYSVSVFLLDDNGVLRAQHDGAPQDGTSPTNTWQPDSIVLDTHHIPLPENLAPGEYNLAVKVYNSADGTILRAEGATQVNDEYLVVTRVRVE